MKNCLFLALIILYLPTAAQIQFNGFQEVLNYADAHALVIKSAVIGEQIALAEKKEAKSYLLPSINASLGYNDNITLQPTLVPAQLLNPDAAEGTFQQLNFGTKYLYSRGMMAQWDILNFQKIFAAKTAQLQVEISKVNTDVQRFNTYNQLASTYYSILLTRESVRIHEENVRVAEAIYEHAKDKYQQGLISLAEQNRAEMNTLQNQRNLDRANNNLQQYFKQLQSQLNTSEQIAINDQAEGFALQNTVITAIHPEVIWQEMELKKHRSLWKQSKALRLPSISLVYQYNQNWATNEFMDFSNAQKLPQQLFGIKVDFTGLLSFSSRPRIHQSKWKYERQQLQLQSTQIAKKQEDAILQLQLRQNADQLDKNKKILSLQQQNDDHAEDQYQSGIISLDQRLDKYEDLLVIQDQYLQSLAAFTLSQYKVYIRQIIF